MPQVLEARDGRSTPVCGPPCIVVGLHQNGLGVARALGRRGVRVIAIDQPDNRIYGATRYAKRVSTPHLNDEGLIETLVDAGASLRSPAVLILTLDRSVLLVSEHRARLEPYFVHSLPADAVIRQLMDKTETERFAREHAFNLPRTFSVRTEEDLERAIAELGVPCILKPAVKSVAFVQHSPKKAFLVKSIDELRDTWNRVAQWEDTVVVQEWIPGPETRLVFCLYYFDEAGQPLASFGGRKIRQFIPHCGTACAAEPWEDEIAWREGVRFFQAAGYRGFGAIEFKIDPEGKYYLIEPTVGRTEHIFALAAANGINLPYAGYCHMAGLPIPPMRRRRRPVVYVDWKRDLRAARALVRDGELSWPDWLSSIARPRQHALLAMDDAEPMIRYAIDRTANKARRWLARTGRRIETQVEQWRPDSRLAAVGAAWMPRPAPDTARAHIDAALDWICAAQDAAGSGGVARGYSCSAKSGYPIGWQAPYPETTGYIIPTLFDAAVALERRDLIDRALRMSDWELTIQDPSGGFPGGTLDKNRMPVVFNTGMVLQGLTRALSETGESKYAEAIHRAAEFVLRAQARDGAWRRFVNIDGGTQIHAYDCLVNWGLVEAARLIGEPRWIEAAVRNLDFTLTLQSRNGWFSNNALRPKRNDRPITHTIAYTTAGLLEAGVLLDEPRFVQAALRTASAVAKRMAPDGHLAGQFDAEWRPASEWSCLTGAAQMAIVWWRLFELGQGDHLADVARRATAYVCCRQETSLSVPGVRGGIAGSFPFDGRYGRYQFLNWAAKFLLDALLLEERLKRAASPRAARVDRVSVEMQA